MKYIILFLLLLLLPSQLKADPYVSVQYGGYQELAFSLGETSGRLSGEVILSGKYVSSKMRYSFLKYKRSSYYFGTGYVLLQRETVGYYRNFEPYLNLGSQLDLHYVRLFYESTYLYYDQRQSTYAVGIKFPLSY